MIMKSVQQIMTHPVLHVETDILWISSTVMIMRGSGSWANHIVNQKKTDYLYPDVSKFTLSTDSNLTAVKRYLLQYTTSHFQKICVVTHIF